jgi:hypothetical protein
LPPGLLVYPQALKALPHDLELLVRELLLPDVVVKIAGHTPVPRLAQVLYRHTRR